MAWLRSSLVFLVCCIGFGKAGVPVTGTAPPPGNAVIDVVVATDYQMYLDATQIYPDDDPVIAVKLFVLALFQEVNYHLSNLELVEVLSLRVNILAVYVPMTEADSPHSAYDGPTAMGGFQTWLTDKGLDVGADESIMLLSSPILLSGVGYLGYLTTSSMCNAPSRALLTVNSLHHAYRITRAIVRGMGASLEDTDYCPEGAGFLLERGLSANFDQPSDFSTCTQNDIDNYLANLLATNPQTTGDCLYETFDLPANSLFDLPFMPAPHAGEVYTGDEICQINFVNPNSTLCPSEAPPIGECGYILCEGSTACERVQNPQYGHCRVRESSVEVDGVCIDGVCTYLGPPITTADVDTTFYSCKRRGQECGVTPDAVCENHRCSSCDSGYWGYDCSLDSSAVNWVCPQECMNDGICINRLEVLGCYCTKNYTGPLCETLRYDVVFTGEVAMLQIIPKMNFQGSVELLFAPNIAECQFGTIELGAGYETAYQLLLDPLCSDAIFLDQEGGYEYVLVLISYIDNLVMGIDEIIKLRLGGTQVVGGEITSGPISVSSVSELRETNVVRSPDNGLSGLVTVLFRDDTGTPVVESTFGQQISVRFVLGEDPIYNHLKLKSLTASNANTGAEVHLLVDGCPYDATAEAILGTSTPVYDGNTVDVPFYMFTFGDQEEDLLVQFTAEFDLCSDSHQGNCNATVTCSLSERLRRSVKIEKRQAPSTTGDVNIGVESPNTGTASKNTLAKGFLKVRNPFVVVHVPPKHVQTHDVTSCEESAMKIAMFAMIGAVFFMLILCAALLAKVVIGRMKEKN